MDPDPVVSTSPGAVPYCLTVLIANPGGERGASPAGGLTRQQDLALRMKNLKTFLETRGAGLAHSGGGHQGHFIIFRSLSFPPWC